MMEDETGDGKHDALGCVKESENKEN